LEPERFIVRTIPGRGNNLDGLRKVIEQELFKSFPEDLEILILKRIGNSIAFKEITPP